MLIRIRRHLKREDGVSLVEMMISMFILSIGLLAMLSTFMVSARSVLDQRAKANATRVATEELERLRPVIFDTTFDELAAEQPCVLGDPASLRPPLTVDGREYCVSTVVEEPGSPPGSGSPPGYREIEATVRWMVGDVERSAVHRTGVSSGVEVPETRTTLPAISVQMTPNPTRAVQRSSVPGYWRPAQDVSVTLNVINTATPYTGDLLLRWQRDNDLVWEEEIVTAGVPEMIAATRFVEELNGHDEGVALFEVSTVDQVQVSADPVQMSSLTTDYRLAMYGYYDVLVNLNFSTSSGNRLSIPVTIPNTNNNPCSGNRCSNADALYFWLTNAPPNATRATVMWDTPTSATATQRTVDLVKQSDGNITTGGWLSTSSRKLLPDAGAALPGNITMRVQLYEGTTPIYADGTVCSGGCAQGVAVRLVAA